MSVDQSQTICRYINRELSWLDFNQRVLNEADCTENPLLERLKFLSITGGNLDEFFMVRVGGLHLLLDSPQQIAEPTGLLPDGQLEAISKRVRKMISDQYECLEKLTHQLEDHGIRRILPDQLNLKQTEYLRSWFQSRIYSNLCPIGLNPQNQECSSTADRFFPLLVGSPLNLLVRLKINPEKSLKADTRQTQQNLPIESPFDEVDSPDGERFAVIPLGEQLERFVSIPADGEFQFTLLEDLVGEFVSEFFENQKVLECVPFRLTRNADMRVDEDGASDLLRGMQKILTERKESGCVRLEIPQDVSPESLSFMKSSLAADDRDIYFADGPLQIKDWMSVATLPGYVDLKNEAWPVQSSAEFPADKSIFQILREGDRLLYHPYQSFDPVVEMVQQAADDPKVLSIKQTLYRTSKNSPIVQALERAALAGKDVTVIVELKARFDEARNIQWARRLEQAGVNVIYGVRGLKIHAKILLIVRKDSDRIRRYLQFGTGNYNEATAGIYSDVSYFTCDNVYGNDGVNFFNAIAGLSTPQNLQKLSMAPFGIRRKIVEMIEVETENAKRGHRSGIIAKVNSLADTDLIDALYKASQAGVPIKLNVRGICCLRPGVPGLSETIEVVSVVDRYLEHARILQFEHGGDRTVFITSADWMGRNLDRRVELLVPVEDKKCRDRLIRILDHYFQDNMKALTLNSDGLFKKVAREEGAAKFQSQLQLQTEAFKLAGKPAEDEMGMFQPHTGSEES